MANVNRVILIGRLTADPESRTFSNGGKVTNIRFAVNNRKKNQQTGQWEDEPVFLDCSVFNRGEHGRQADLLEQSCRKGSQLYIEGHLVFDQWQDKTTSEKRSKLKVVIDNFQFLDPKGQGQVGGEERPAPTRRQPFNEDAESPNYTENDIPF